MATFDNRAFLTRLNSDHQRLELLTQNVLRRFEDVTPESWERTDRADTTAMVVALRDDLSKHIQEEDEGGCIEEAVSQSPSLINDAREVFRESDQLQRTMCEVIELISANAINDARKAFVGFAAALRLYEQHEEDVVEKGMNAFPYEH